MFPLQFKYLNCFALRIVSFSMMNARLVRKIIMEISLLDFFLIGSGKHLPTIEKILISMTMPPLRNFRLSCTVLHVELNNHHQVLIRSWLSLLNFTHRLTGSTRIFQQLSRMLMESIAPSLFAGNEMS